MCLNSLTRGCCPLELPLLLNWLKSVIINGWGKLCSIVLLILIEKKICSEAPILLLVSVVHLFPSQFMQIKKEKNLYLAKFELSKRSINQAITCCIDSFLNVALPQPLFDLFIANLYAISSTSAILTVNWTCPHLVD